MIEALYDYIIKMGYITLPLYFTGLIGWFYTIEIMIFLYYENRISYVPLREFEKCIKSKKNDTLTKECIKEKSATNLFLLSLLKNRERSLEIVNANCRDVVLGNITQRVQKLRTIRILASIATLLGLLGTVNGMISTFKVISFFGNSNPMLMADGISEALLTTQSGLIIAFPLLFMHVVIRNGLKKIKNRIDRYYAKFIAILY
ncbi:MotA/TolQ/ExbB proton channel family protein [Spirochaetota bacterium]